RADDGADDLGVDAEVPERLEQRGADRLAVALVGPGVRLAAQQQLLGRERVVDLLRLGDGAAALAHRGSRDLDLARRGLGRDACWLVGATRIPARRAVDGVIEAHRLGRAAVGALDHRHAPGLDLNLLIALVELVEALRERRVAGGGARPRRVRVDV